MNETAFFHLNGQRAYRTGDWGRYREGMLFFEGRIDNQIKLHGYRIELADVEANLRALAGVRDAVVLPVLKQGAVDSLAAFVILNEQPLTLGLPTGLRAERPDDRASARVHDPAEVLFPGELSHEHQR